MPRSDRQIVAAAFRGQLTKPTRELSDAYVARLAREVRSARAEGRRPERQAGRGHRPREVAPGRVSAREHPPQFVVRAVDGQRQRVTTRAVQPTGLGIIVQREYVEPAAALRWLQGLPASVGVQVVGHGELLPEYGHDDASDADQAEAEAQADETGEPLVTRSWRSVYTGNAAGDPDENGVTMRSYGDMAAALDRVFVPGTVDRVIVRWQR